MKIICNLFLILNFFNVIADEKSFYNDHERGWHWYEKRIESDELKKITPQLAMVELKKYQKTLEEAKALAVMYPTSANIYNYQKLQFEMLNKAEKFAEIWMKNVYKNSDIDSTLKFPVSQNARHIYLDKKREDIEERIKKLSREYGLFFFFKNDCRYCIAFSPVVKSFSKKYHWEVLAISDSGEKHKLFERSVQDNGLSSYWNVDVYPSLFAVNPKTGHVIPIARGMISIEEMEERIMAIARDNGNE